jgi:hypothetical protein
MKNINQDLSDSLRPEYRRPDFGEMVRGKHAKSQVEFAELVRLLLTCIGEDEGLTFIPQSPGQHVAISQRGDWTYEVGDANQITFRWWLNETECLEEAIVNAPGVTDDQGRSELQSRLLHHIHALRSRVDAL